MEMHLGEEGGVGSDLKTRSIWKDRKTEDIQAGEQNGGWGEGSGGKCLLRKLEDVSLVTRTHIFYKPRCRGASL